MKITKILQARKTIQTRKSKLSKTYSHRKQGRQNCQKIPTSKNDTNAAQTRKSKLSKAYTHRKQGRQTYQKTHTEKLYKRCAGQQTKTCNYQKVSMLQIRKNARRNRSLRLAATAKSHECIVLNVLHRIIFGEGYDGCPPWRLSLCVSFFFSI